MPSITNLATTAALSANINEVKQKLPNIANIATTTTFVCSKQNRIFDLNLSVFNIITWINESSILTKDDMQQMQNLLKHKN